MGLSKIYQEMKSKWREDENINVRQNEIQGQALNRGKKNK